MESNQNLMGPPVLSSPTSFSWEAVARLGRLVRKELLEILRDRRTILTLVLMPVLLYPVLTVAFKQFFAAHRFDPSHGLEYRFGFASAAEEALFEKWLLEGQAQMEKPGKDKKPPVLKSKVQTDLEEMVKSGEVDVGIRLKNGDALAPGHNALLEGELIFLPTSPGALGALNYLDRCLGARNVALLKKQMKQAEGNEGIVVPSLRRSPIQEPGTGSLVSLSALVPLILILMTITGAVYPAIDLTAGERERGTLEILVAAPVPRLGLLFAKYVSVLTVAVLTALVNLVTMTLTLQLSGLGHLLFGSRGLPILLVVQMFGLLFLFAGFFSAVLLCLTSFARSFKEAQAYLIPLILASMGPGLIGMIPGMQLDFLLAVTPLINIVLLARDLFEGGADPLMAFLVVASTLMYALAAISLAAKIFGAEGVLYSEQSSWSDLWRRPEEPQPAASVGGALWCLALMIPTNFLFQALLRYVLPEGAGLAWHLPAMALGSTLLFLVLPSIDLFRARVDFTSGLGWHKVSWPALLGGLLLGLSLWPLVLQLMLQLQRQVPDWMQEHVQALLQGWSRLIPLAVLTLGWSGFAEEFFFRGFLFSALARATKPAGTIGLTAILFGLMHCLAGGGLGLEQLVPATLMGVILGTIRWQTASVFPGMALHVCHNAMLAIMSPEAHAWQNQIPLFWLQVGVVGTCVGAGLVYLGKKNR